MKRLLLLNALLLLFFNPYMLPPVVFRFFKWDELLLVDYPFFFWSILAVSFLVTLGVHLKRYLKVDELTVPENNRSPVKGLQPFLFPDKEVFSRLQRDDILEACFSFITGKTHRFAVLCGESGSGKTSFLQAGLIPRLSQENSPYQCVYIKFSNEFVVNSVRNAFINQLGMEEEDTKDKDFISLLNKAREVTEGKTLILIFDQFEQFFVHRKLKEKRKPFIDIIADWYRNYTRYPMKILISMRNDLMGYLYEFQMEMEYPLVAGENYFFLEKFTPTQSFEILKVIAELESLPMDEEFVENIARKDLPGKEDGLVSPLDIQIFALMIREHKSEDGSAFTRKAYETFGGVEGLLLRFLRQQLHSPRNTNRAALKILILLTDFERNVRAGLKTFKFIQTRLQMNESSVQKILDWLERLGLILKSTSKTQKPSYELSHEKLIPPLQKLAGALIYRVEKTDQILSQRVKEWLGNERSKKHLLSIKEYSRIKRYTTFLTWGTNKEDKERLVFESEKNIVLRTLQVFGLSLFLSSPLILWLTPTGQIWQLKRDLIALSFQSSDFRYSAKATIALMISGEPKKALRIIRFIDEPEKKASLFINTSKVAYQLSDKIKSKRFLQLAHENAKELEPSIEKVELFIEIAKESYQNTYKKEAVALLEESSKIANKIANRKARADLLLKISNVFLELYVRDKALDTLQAAEELVVGRSEVYYEIIGLLDVSKLYVRLNEMERAKELLEDVEKLPRKIRSNSYKYSAYMHIARTYLYIALEKNDAVYLKDAESWAKDIKYKSDKSATLREISLGAAHLYEETKRESFLDIADEVTDEISLDADRSTCYFTLAKIALENNKKENAEKFLQQAWKSAEDVGSYESRAGLLRDIASSYHKIKDEEEAYQVMQKAIRYAKRIRYDYDKAAALKDIASLALELGDSEKALTFIDKSVSVAKGIREDIYKCSALSDIAIVAAQLQDKSKAKEILQKAAGIAGVIPYESYRSSSLRYIAEKSLQVSLQVKEDSVFFPMALKLIAKIKSLSDRAVALEKVSLFFRKKDNMGKAESFLQQSLQYAKKIEVEQSKNVILHSLALYHIEMGNWFSARKIANSIDSVDARLDAYSSFLRLGMELENPELKKIKIGKESF
ncbi:MAG: hypothetical protein AAF518_16315 [Spirochaetota bacterium]